MGCGSVPSVGSILTNTTRRSHPPAGSHVVLPSAPTGAMTQPPQEGFDRSVEDALKWMKAVQERLQVNDNTQGPRAALEARLRETEVCRGRGFRGPVALAGSLPLQASGFGADKWQGCVSNLDVLESPGDLGWSADSDLGGQGSPPRVPLPANGIANMIRVTQLLLVLGPCSLSGRLVLLHQQRLHAARWVSSILLLP